MPLIKTTSTTQGETHLVSWHSVCLEFRESCTLSTAHDWTLLGVHGVRGDQHMHALHCVYSLWQGRGTAASSIAPCICIQTSSTSSHTPLPLFVLVFREEDSGSQSPMCSVVLQYTCTCMWAQVVGKLLFFSWRLIICVAMDVVCALPSHARGNIIFTNEVTFYLLLNGNSNFGSLLPNREWHRKIAV